MNRIEQHHELIEMLMNKSTKCHTTKQKNFRNYTLDELLRLGFSIHLHHHDLHNESDAKALTSKFEGMKQSSYDLNEDLKVVRAWKDKVEISVFLKITEE